MLGNLSRADQNSVSQNQSGHTQTVLGDLVFRDRVLVKLLTLGLGDIDLQNVKLAAVLLEEGRQDLGDHHLAMPAGRAKKEHCPNDRISRLGFFDRTNETLSV